MSVFFSETGSLNKLTVSGSLAVSGSGSGVFSISGNQDPAIQVFDLASGDNIFQITSASLDLFKIDPNGNAHISGSLVVTGSINKSANMNISADVTSNNVSQLVFSNANGISFGLNGSTLTAGVNTDPIIEATFPYFNPYDAYIQILGTWGNASLFMQPMQAHNIQLDRIAIPMYISATTQTASTMGLSFSLSWGLYSRNDSSFSLMTDYTKSTTFQGTIGSGQTATANGIRLWTMGLTKTLTEGQYYAAMISSVTNTRGTISNLVISQQASSFYGIFGEPYNRTVQYTRGLGFYSTTTNAFPSSIAISQLYGAATYTTAAASATQVLRPPLFYLVSQTF